MAWAPPAPVFNINCGAPAGAEAVMSSGLLPALTTQTDQYLAEGTKPFLAIPLWIWIGLAGAAVWWFWGRKHPEYFTWSAS